jgi:hypothetical protein
MASIEVTNPGEEADSILEILRERVSAHDVVIEDGSTGVLSVTDSGTVDDLPLFLEQQLEACVKPDTEWGQYFTVRAD